MDIYKNNGESNPFHNSISDQLKFLDILTDRLINGAVGTVMWESHFIGDEIEIAIERNLSAPYVEGSFIKQDDEFMSSIINITYATPHNGEEQTLSIIFVDDGKVYGQIHIDQEWGQIMPLGDELEARVAELIKQLIVHLKPEADIDYDTAVHLRELTQLTLDHVMLERLSVHYGVFDSAIGVSLSQKLLEVATRPDPYAYVNQKFARSPQDQSVVITKRPFMNPQTSNLPNECIEWRQRGNNRNAIAKLEVFTDGTPYITGTPDIPLIDVPPTVVEPFRKAKPSEIAIFLKLLQDSSLQ